MTGLSHRINLSINPGSMVVSYTMNGKLFLALMTSFARLFSAENKINEGCFETGAFDARIISESVVSPDQNSSYM